MGFKLQRVNRDGNESALEIINSDYHNGNCIFIQPSSELEAITADLKYLVAEFSDYSLIIYPENSDENLN